MSYLQALLCAREARSDARPRSLSRYERPEAFWEITIEPAEEERPRPSFPPSTVAPLTADTLPARPSASPHPPLPAVSQPPQSTPPPADPTPLATPRLPGAQPATAPPAPEPRPARPGLSAAAAPARSSDPSPPVMRAGAALPPPDRPPPDQPPPLKRDHPLEAHPLPRSADPAATEPDPQTTIQTPARPRTPEPASSAAPASTTISGAPAPAAVAPEIVVEIGQIDIRLEAPTRAKPVLSAPPRHNPTPILSLDDYLRGRP